jgi:hypothetical protein
VVAIDCSNVPDGIMANEMEGNIHAFWQGRRMEGEWEMGKRKDENTCIIESRSDIRNFK